MLLLSKRPLDERNYDFDFSSQPEIVAGGAIASATVSYTAIQGSGVITVGDPVTSNTRVQFKLSGGTLGDQFEFQCVATLANGLKLEGYGRLTVTKD